MIIPKDKEDFLASSPAHKSLVDNFPQAYFGHFFKYPKQAEIIRTWLKVRPKICVITGWRRTGKTQCAAYLGTCWLTKKLDHGWPGARSMGITDTYVWEKKFQGERVGIIAGSSLDHVENVLLPMYRAMIPPGMVKHWFSRTNKVIEVSHKCKFIIRTYEQDIKEWQSGTSQFTHLDEEAPYEVMMEVLERSRTSQGKIFITVALDDADVSWLPQACTNPVKFFGTDSFLHFKMGVEDVPNEMYPEEEKQNVYRQYDDTPMRLAVRKGDFAYTSGRWWKNFDAAVHVIPEFKIPPFWLRFRAVDAGIAAPSACVWGAMHPNGDLFLYREYYKAGTTIEERCRDIVELSGNRLQKDGEMWNEIQCNEKYVMTLLDYHEFKRDPISGNDLSYFYVKSGLLVQESTSFGQEARREVANRWLKVDYDKNHFITHKPGAPRVYIFDNCVNLIYEVQTKVVKRASTEKSAISERKIAHRGDHAQDSSEYLFCELENWCDDHLRNKKKNDRVWGDDNDKD